MFSDAISGAQRFAAREAVLDGHRALPPVVMLKIASVSRTVATGTAENAGSPVG